jgi:hypothetical protein
VQLYPSIKTLLQPSFSGGQIIPLALAFHAMGERGFQRSQFFADGHHRQTYRRGNHRFHAPEQRRH